MLLSRLGRRRAAAITTIAGACAALALGPAAGATTSPAVHTAAPVARLADEVIPSLSTFTDLGAVPADKPVQIAVALTHDDAAIKQFEATLYDEASPNYQHWLTPDQFEARFDASPQRLATVRNFATAHGLSLYNQQGVGDLTLVSGTAAQAEQTFNVSIHNFRAADGRTFFANVNAPTVPANVGVAGVMGLQDLIQLQIPKGAAATPQAQNQCEAGVCTGLLGPEDLWSVYNQPTANKGQGEKIGIIGEGQTADVIHALRRFEQTRGLPKVPVQVYWTDPGPKTDDAGRVEWELDTQASTGMAPDVSEVRLYFGSSLQVSTLATTLQSWASDPAGPNQVNASLGLCENNPALDGLLGPAQLASGFALTQAVAEGRTFFASAGDTGAGCALVPGLPVGLPVSAPVNGVVYGEIPTAEYPAVDPNATAVGGTVVYTDGAAKPKLVDEHAWDHTGGTRSDFVAAPAYQQKVTALQANFCTTQPNGTPYTAPTICRGTADVSALSGDGTVVLNHKNSTVQANGYDMVDDNVDHTAHGSFDQYNDHFSEGGTSLSSPLWAGMWARVNAAHSRGPLGRANDTIYKVAQSTAGATAFHDVTEGANPLPATPGWDFPTGWGSPNVTALVQAADKRIAPIHNVMPVAGPDPAPISAPAPAFGCPATVTDPEGDGVSLPQSAPQLDIIHADLALASTGETLRAGITVPDLTTNVPEGWTSMSYLVYWTEPATGVAPPASYTKDYYAAEVTVDITGAITYTVGTVAYDDQGDSQYTSNHGVTGHFTPGHNGVVEVDVPLTDIGNPKAGASLGSVGAETDESAPATGLIVDTASNAKPYTLGKASCLK